MKLSDAIEKGAPYLRSRGPSYPYRCCWMAAACGLNGQQVDQRTVTDLYVSNQWSITSGSDLEYWMRMVTINGYDWVTIVAKLREYGF